MKDHKTIPTDTEKSTAPQEREVETTPQTPTYALDNYMLYDDIFCYHDKCYSCKHWRIYDCDAPATSCHYEAV